MEPLRAEEATQYDRQIRLWGLDAQRRHGPVPIGCRCLSWLTRGGGGVGGWGLRIRTTRVALYGARGLGIEVGPLCCAVCSARVFRHRCGRPQTSKNLVLAGIRSLHLIDDQDVTSNDLGAQFFLLPEDIGRNVRSGGGGGRARGPLPAHKQGHCRCCCCCFSQRAAASAPQLQSLNPMVEVRASAFPVSELGAKALADVDVLCVLGVPLAACVRPAAGSMGPRVRWAECARVAQVDLNRLCRERGVRFLAGTTRFGHLGCAPSAPTMRMLSLPGRRGAGRAWLLLLGPAGARVHSVRGWLGSGPPRVAQPRVPPLGGVWCAPGSSSRRTSRAL